MAMNKPPISGGESPFLFIQSTISKDESQGLASKEVRTLAAANPPLTGLPPSSIGPPPMNPQFRNPPPGPGPPSLSRKREQTQLLALESMDPDTHDNIGSHDGNNSFLSTITSSKEREGMWREALRSERKDPVQNLTSRPSDGPDAQCHTSLKEGRQTLEPNTGTVKPDLAVALGLVADNYLSLDVLDGRRDVSKYIAFLLDTIHNLQTKLAYRTSEESTPAPEAIAPREQESSSLIKPHPQILHRVFCAASHHSHDAMVYEDEPVVTKKTEGLCRGEEVVCGTIEVPDVDAYLRKHPSISFVVFKEYRCVSDTFLNLYNKRISPVISDANFDPNRSTISPRQERMKIVSPALLRALHLVAGCKLDQISFEDPCNDSWEMEAPYHFLFHHRRKLRELSKDDAIYTPFVDPLLEYLCANFEGEYLEAETMFSQGLVTETHVEKLFKPNQVVITETKGVYVAHALNEWPVKHHDELQFSGWSWKYDGRFLERAPWFCKLELSVIGDGLDLKRLAVRPIDIVDEELVARLKQRGERFWEMKGHHLVTYDGWDSHHDYFYTKERFMVDMATYSKMHHRWRFGDHVYQPEELLPFDSWPLRIRQEEDLTGDQLLMLPPTTHAYSLREKKWVSVNVEQTTQVVWNKKAFNRLVLEKETKNLLRALIDMRMSDSKKMDDIVVGKGNGLIMLLYPNSRSRRFPS